MQGRTNRKQRSMMEKLRLRKSCHGFFLFVILCFIWISFLTACKGLSNPESALVPAKESLTEVAPVPSSTAERPQPDAEQAQTQQSLEVEAPQESPEDALAPSATLIAGDAGSKMAVVADQKALPSSQAAADFDGEVMEKIQAAFFFNEGKEVTVIGVGLDYFDVALDGGEKVRVLSPVKPKYFERFVNKVGLSDQRIVNGLEVGYQGILKSSKAPQNIMGVGPNVIGVTPAASDGVIADDVAPIFTLNTPLIKGPNDYIILEEMDYDPKSLETSNSKRWLEMFRGLMKGTIWTIFEQSNRYFTNVDKREWDRMTPGKIFDLMEQFEYVIPIPERILSIRDPKYRSDEEKIKNRYILHDYTVRGLVVRVLIPTLQEKARAKSLKKVGQSDSDVAYKAIYTVLRDEEMGDGEKFTWNNPIKIILVIQGKEVTIYLPTQSIIDIQGELYKLPSNLIH